MGKKIDAFNNHFDFISRVIKLILVIVVVTIVWRNKDKINLDETVKNMASSVSYILFENPKSQTTPLIAKTEPVPAISSVAKTPDNPPAKQSSTKPTVDSNKILSFQETKTKIDYLNILQYGQVIFTVDRPYDASTPNLRIEKMLMKGKADFNHPFVYAGKEFLIRSVSEYIGMLVSGGSVEGPVLKGVELEMVRP